MKGTSSAWRHLAPLAVGDLVPAELYVLDYSDGERPSWTVADAEELASGGRQLVLVDPDNGASDLFDTGRRVALTVLTWPSKTLRTQPHMLGAFPGPTLCDLDQQGRRATAGELAAVAS